jgi:hypothetical protein
LLLAAVAKTARFHAHRVDAELLLALDLAF